MFSHVFAGVSDFDRAFRFYSAVMDGLGIELRFCEAEKQWAGWHSPGPSRPLFLIGKSYDGRPHDSGNGQMIAFMAADRATVRKVHEIALIHGDSCEGPPGLRPHYHANYYGAYFRDPDDNKLCVACHDPESAMGGAE